MPNVKCQKQEQELSIELQIQQVKIVLGEKKYTGAFKRNARNCLLCFR